MKRVIAIALAASLGACASGPTPEDLRLRAHLKGLEANCIKGNNNACDIYKTQVNALVASQGNAIAARANRSAAFARAGAQIQANGIARANALNAQTRRVQPICIQGQLGCF
jgi:hypothetical protein